MSVSLQSISLYHFQSRSHLFTFSVGFLWFLCVSVVFAALWLRLCGRFFMRFWDHTITRFTFKLIISFLMIIFDISCEPMTTGTLVDCSKDIRFSF